MSYIESAIIAAFIFACFVFKKFIQYIKTNVGNCSYAFWTLYLIFENSLILPVGTVKLLFFFDITFLALLGIIEAKLIKIKDGEFNFYIKG